MKKLIIIANSFPYENSEPYMETEAEYYPHSLEKIIYSLSVREKNKKRNIPTNIETVPIMFSKTKLIYLIYMFLVLFEKNFYKELIYLKREKKLNIKTISQLLVFLSRARYELKKIKKDMYNKGITREDSGVIYSYRFEYQAYIAVELKKYFPSFEIICRAHGYDLYEFNRDSNYIPFRPYILNNITNLLAISNHGKKYLEEKYPQYKDKMMVSYLGTKNIGTKYTDKKNNILRIVTCANLLPVKRIDKLVDALSKLPSECEVYWDHYGTGRLEEELKELAKRKLSNNIHYDFKGFIANETLLNMYLDKEYDVLINTSDSEGLPVSIMEATSIGIPVIATNVGGTNEIIIDDYNGWLFSHRDNEILVDLIKKIIAIDSETYNKIQENARENWERHFVSEKNYLEFSKYLNNLCENN